MSNETEENRLRNRRASTLPPPTIPEEPSNSSAISALIHSTPIIDPDVVPNPPTGSTSSRTRRRSSVSIIQALVASSHLLATHDARKR